MLTKFDGFDQLDQATQTIMRDMINTYSIDPESDRLVIPVMIDKLPRFFLAEIPVDDPSMSMLAAVNVPAANVKARVYYSPKQKSTWDKWNKNHPGVRVQNSTGMQGCGVILITETFRSIDRQRNRSMLQFHPLCNARSGGHLTSKPLVGMVNRCTSSSKQSATSQGCIAIATEASVISCGGFNEVDSLNFLEASSADSLYTLMSPTALRKLKGDDWFVKRCTDHGFSPTLLTLAQCGFIIDDYRKLKGLPAFYRG